MVIYSDYKKHPTVKFLAGCGVTGETSADTVPDGNGGKGSDVMMTDDTNILEIVPFGSTAKVDKGFIVDNIASKHGVRIDRPQKRKRHQKQQSAIDTAQTQKIGNTRIIIENVNGGVKSDVRYLNALIPCHQFGIISQLVRIGFLMQNFKKPLIQNNNPDSKLDERAKGVPCRAEVRWYGATCAGLSDVRGSIYKWGLNCEIERHSELQKMEAHKDKSMVEISEMVLSERWDLKKREELYAIDNREYKGDKFRQDLYEKHGVN
uniref:DDE Tnp4 domain-containing protein n=1 Tax=Skeletonema marinoi TaxID=267567 RepID=A0A7S2PD48_9STRA|mmetsp:Transcript_18313/g.30987  ORF Transcript_18313/g.30987 Transcript_18313/m.30987 type:complete len:263 (+) Transcript_18313:514-1302(+)